MNGQLWFAWCSLHQKFELETECLNCRTREYLKKHPGVAGAVFGEGVTGVQREDHKTQD